MSRGTETREQKIEKIKVYLKTREDIIGFDEESFMGMTKKVSFIDKDYGCFLSKPGSLMQRNTSHRKRIKEKIRQTSLKKYGVDHPKQSNIVKEKQKITNLKRYGVTNPIQNKEIREKSNQTNLKKYGVLNPFQNKKIQEKIRQTNLIKYGFENPNKNKEIRNKIDDTNIVRYGVKCSFQNQEVKEKIKQTNLRKYGVENSCQRRDIREKQRQTNLKKYGADNPFANIEIQNKIQKTNLEKYGVKWTSLHKETREKQKQTNLKKYGADNPFKSKDIISKIKTNNVIKYGVENPFQNKEILEKAKKTTIERYGSDCIFRNKEIQEKIKQTNLRKYGVEYNQQNKEIKNKAMQTRHKNLLDNKGSSKGEIELKNWLQSLGLNPKKHSSGANEIDLYIENKGIGIEYNGLYWHSSKRKTENYHLDKMLYYKNYGIKIINIWEHWWLNKKNQTKNLIKHILNINLIFINENNIKIKQIDNKIAILFINKNHIEIPDLSFNLAIGIYYKRLLLAVCTIYCENNIFINIYRLSNYLIKNDIAIISEYLSNYFKQDLHIMLNRGTFNEEEYLHNKWICRKEIPPSSQLIKKNNKEFFEIYDCGKLLLVYLFTKNL